MARTDNGLTWPKLVLAPVVAGRNLDLVVSAAIQRRMCDRKERRSRRASNHDYAWGRLGEPPPLWLCYLTAANNSLWHVVLLGSDCMRLVALGPLR